MPRFRLTDAVGGAEPLPSGGVDCGLYDLEVENGVTSCFVSDARSARRIQRAMKQRFTVSDTVATSSAEPPVIPARNTYRHADARSRNPGVGTRMLGWRGPWLMVLKLLLERTVDCVAHVLITRFRCAFRFSHLTPLRTLPYRPCPGNPIQWEATYGRMPDELPQTQPRGGSHSAPPAMRRPPHRVTRQRPSQRCRPPGSPRRTPVHGILAPLARSPANMCQGPKGRMAARVATYLVGSPL
jgi:hypothetical protein